MLISPAFRFGERSFEAAKDFRGFYLYCLQQRLKAAFPRRSIFFGDSYIQAAENAKTFDEVATIAITMYDDFVRRVNRCRMDPKLSPPVQKCCDYIK